MKSSTKRNTCCFLLLTGSLLVMLVYQWSSVQSFTSTQEKMCINNEINETTVLALKKPTKYILQWTKPDTEPFVFWGQGQEGFIKRKCKVKDCYVTPNRSFFPCITDFDAIAFHGPEITTYMPGPNIRSEKQKYVYVSMESSHYYPICDVRYDGFFNWTWTYKLDSDEPYGYITIRNKTGDIIGPKKDMHWIQINSMLPINNETKSRLEKKNKTAAWFVSNCNSLSKREKFVEQLQKELKKYSLGIDIFGGCKWASKRCPRTKMQECLKMIQDEYYFYLSLENSFSEDYVTEKLLTALKNYAVPVVFGEANYTRFAIENLASWTNKLAFKMPNDNTNVNLGTWDVKNNGCIVTMCKALGRFMPDGIYLHGGQMNVQDLAKEMNDIINDKERYYGFFKWRNHYSYHYRDEAPDSDDHCKMCEMLHDETLMSKKTTYEDFRNWWNVPGKCG